MHTGKYPCSGRLQNIDLCICLSMYLEDGYVMFEADFYEVVNVV